ncbi:MAG TPA: tRNA uridine(34) 5-carboxymethylaminomethyl modification radical SAM/GNAT enzyme Elp3 [Candidatus Nanoarchaeia archaeon]|nr:tRNA uridine(34) 5-carboxymethylaminomethyl modification radical SAM/GNAT enzyme Elp3 [Candidatus Nanoarchaeia archaeon]
MDFYTELQQRFEEKKPAKDELSRIKLELCSKYGLKKIPTDIEIGQHLSGALVSKPSRTLAGVSPVAIMARPSNCRHGSCIYCPGGLNSVFGDIPKSYTGKEPATRRAIRNNFDAYLQTMNRLEQYILLGHSPEKAELIIMGGTFPSEDEDYQKKFITEAFQAMNDFSRLFYKDGRFNRQKFREFFEVPSSSHNKERDGRINKNMLEQKSARNASIDEEHALNEGSNIRCVSLVIETRPDYATLEIANRLLELGVTKIELGVQTIYDDVLKKINRGHDSAESKKATALLKDLGFKVAYHVMPGLPGVSKERDIKALKEYADNEDFRPDMLKIYPCLVLRGTNLYEEWLAGKFKPISTQEAADIICEFKKICPEWIRIMRVQRDIPTFMTEDGVDKTNLRQYVEKLAMEKGIKCRCIRCREPKTDEHSGEIEYKTAEYQASGGKEFFISAIDVKRGNIVGFCRLRFPSQALRREIANKSSLVRELRVYGKSTEIGEIGNVQHRGIGKRLMAIAEEISLQNGKNKVVVIAGIGAKEYFRKLRYAKEGPYMVKEIGCG